MMSFHATQALGLVVRIRAMNLHSVQMVKQRFPKLHMHYCAEMDVIVLVHSQFSLAANVLQYMKL